MTLRCRPGDLALIVGESWYSPAIKGRIVHVESAAPSGANFTLPNGQTHLAVGAGYWVCRFVGGPVYVPYGFEQPWDNRLSSHAAIPDRVLRPIRPDADPVDIETREPVEASTC